MAITREGDGNNSSVGTSATVAVGVGLVDDLLVLQVIAAGVTNTISTPTGYTLIRATGDGNGRMTTFFKFATVTNEAAPVSTLSLSAQWIMDFIRYRTVDKAVGLANSEINNGSGSTPASAVMTMSGGNRLVIHAVQQNSNRAMFSAPTSGHAIVRTDTGGVAAVVTTEAFPTTGAATQTSITSDQTNDWLSHIFHFNEGAPPPVEHLLAGESRGLAVNSADAEIIHIPAVLRRRR